MIAAAFATAIVCTFIHINNILRSGKIIIHWIKFNEIFF